VSDPVVVFVVGLFEPCTLNLAVPGKTVDSRQSFVDKALFFVILE